ncbi:hypothetical protein GS584_25455 [Rhodococcus hoagii]|nr:hypothetical protein [Prescottella equi]
MLSTLAAIATFVDHLNEPRTAPVAEIVAYHVDDAGIRYATALLADGTVTDIDVQDIDVRPVQPDLAAAS